MGSFIGAKEIIFNKNHTSRYFQSYSKRALRNPYNKSILWCPFSTGTDNYLENNVLRSAGAETISYLGASALIVCAKKFVEYGCIIIKSHGLYRENEPFLLLTPERYYGNPSSYDNEGIIPYECNGVQYYCITPSFFDFYPLQEDSLIFLATCSGGRLPASLVESLLKNGAKVIYTFDRDVSVGYSDDCRSVVMIDLYHRSNNTRDAFLRAINISGAQDPNPIDPTWAAQFKIFESIRLLDLAFMKFSRIL